MGFAERLSQLMEERNVSISELARAVGVSRQSVMRWLNDTSPSYDKVSKLAEYFGISLEHFYQDVINPEYIDTVLEGSKRTRLGVPIVGSIRAGYPVESFDMPDGYVKIEHPNLMNIQEDLEETRAVSPMDKAFRQTGIKVNRNRAYL